MYKKYVVKTWRLRRQCFTVREHGINQGNPSATA